jgi:hypothetical protein
MLSLRPMPYRFVIRAAPAVYAESFSDGKYPLPRLFPVLSRDAASTPETVMSIH